MEAYIHCFGFVVSVSWGSSFLENLRWNKTTFSFKFGSGVEGRASFIADKVKHEAKNIWNVQRKCLQRLKLLRHWIHLSKVIYYARTGVIKNIYHFMAASFLEVNKKQIFLSVCITTQKKNKNVWSLKLAGETPNTPCLHQEMKHSATQEEGRINTL